MIHQASDRTPSTNAHGDSLSGRYWPTEAQRPGETIRQWVARLDGYSHLDAHEERREAIT